MVTHTHTHTHTHMHAIYMQRHLIAVSNNDTQLTKAMEVGGGGDVEVVAMHPLGYQR